MNHNTIVDKAPEDETLQFDTIIADTIMQPDEMHIWPIVGVVLQNRTNGKYVGF